MAGGRFAAWRRRPAGSVAVGAGKRGDVLLIADALSKTHDGDRMLFQNLSFSISAGDKLAIVGPNGAGKSTLLKIIAGQSNHNGGVVTRNKGARIGYLPQSDMILSSSDEDDDDAPSSGRSGKKGSAGRGGGGGGGVSGMTVLQAVLSSDNDVVRAVQEYERALAGAGDRVTAELQAAIERMDAMQAWEVDSEVRR
ncbi:ATP-binding cassette, sub-family F, member 3 [Monoraphidium neglectum]|uniref:ATP-binding cassette, sub-family F, member 3 n=1 Tax=Monoraphidium neglectum TaxID=145388 RepID=A0A0D2MQ01_9CHLO|nr:ATP-binding cassette, sub-family F, member 3 [Monoraphidium neglectum]KIZ04735.1 ATP-binding cassette, sub-family F, member 3 [Monoraphidium neglectum]|eukprot:XP_013903754.1 ATP-binding cassette, sub-family F, member 3 [Monoraphidium neglectum]